jgi:hypothetical protein
MHPAAVGCSERHHCARMRTAEAAQRQLCWLCISSFLLVDSVVM